MTVQALLKTPLNFVDRASRGVVLGRSEGQVGGARMRVTITQTELHFGWADRDGPSFAIPLAPLIKEACKEIEALLGITEGENHA